MKNKILFSLITISLSLLLLVGTLSSEETDKRLSSAKGNEQITTAGNTADFLLQQRLGVLGKDPVTRKEIRQNGKLDRMAAISPKRAQKLTAVSDRILVKYKEGKFRSTAETALRERFKLKSKKVIPFARIHVYRVTETRNRRTVLDQLNKDPMVEYAEPDYIVRITATPNDSGFDQLYGLHNTGQTNGTVDADIDAPEAWNLSVGSSDVVVAVIDSGVDYTHSDLAGNMWQNPGETPGDGIDNDGNGYIDDIYGIDAYNNDSDPFDDNRHGTHCAGTIGAVGNNGIGVAGVCWNVKIMALKFLSAGGSGYTSDAITCIQYAIDNGANIMSNSWGGGGYSQALYDAIESAKTAGILFVAAAGNSGTNNDSYAHYPSSYSNDNIIAVAATDHNDQLASFSCYGPTSVDVAAPGVAIYSTVPGNAYDFLSGTSMATPHVAGLSALLKSHYPLLSWDQIKTILLDTVESLPSLENKILTGGRINAYYALSNSPPPSLTVTNPTMEAFVSGTVAVTADVSDLNGISKVEFYIDDVLKSTLNTAPWQYDWDTTVDGDGYHLIKIIAYNLEPRTTVKEVPVGVNNSGLPGVMILEPVADAELMHMIDISAKAQYDPGIAKVEFLVDDGLIGEDTTAPYEYTWNSLGTLNGVHSIKVRAYGTDNSIGESTVSVNLANQYLPQAERDALIALYTYTNGDWWWGSGNWKKYDGSFNDPGTEYSWYGITVENGHVTEIYLEYNDLYGVLPSELGNLTQLRDLALYWNYIGGSIPPELGNLTQLEYLDFDDNMLVGTIPSELGNLTNLKILWLDYNYFTGNLPASFGNLTNLEYLFAYSCMLSGSIPPELGNMTNIKEMYLDDNNITGSIPPELGNLSQLEILTLYWNQLSGAIPPQLGNLTQLTYLDFDDNNLSGTIPPELGNLSLLEELWINDNDVTGNIPDTFCNLTNLRFLFLYNARLSGAIPANVGNMTNLNMCYFQGNNIVGNIPASVVNLSNLSYVNAGYNGLYTTDENLRNYFTSIDSDWNATQTVAPGNLLATAASLNSIRVSWTPIPFTSYTGGYTVFYSTTPGGPYTEVGTTTDKMVSSFEVTGLTPGITYYFVVRTHTDPHTNNLNTVISDYSTEVSGIIQNSYTLSVQSSPSTGAAITVTPVDTNSNGSGTTNFTRFYSIGTTVTLTAPETFDSKVFSKWIVGANEYTQAEIQVNMGSAVTATAVYTDAPSITVTAPNGGEFWNIGDTQPITWTSTGDIGTVTIEYSIDNGSNWTVLQSSTENDGSYSWTVVEPVSDQCIVRIRDTAGSSTDSSDAIFGIGYPPLPEAERNALIDLYNSTNGDSWTDNTNWKKQDGSFNDPGTENTWKGITVTDATVTKVDLRYNELRNAIPASIGNLINVETIDLGINHLTGSIPPEIGNLSSLKYLYLDYNMLTGPIPAEIGNLSLLEYLKLGANALSGSIPPELANLTALQNLGLRYNQFTGTILPAIGNLSQLRWLDLSNNQLTGTIPSELGNLSNLALLYVGQNQLSGAIPPELGNLTNLQNLSLSDNELTGTIPTEIGNLTKLYYLVICNTQLEGEIPSEFGNLTQLRYLYLYNNQLSGNIPPELSNLTYLYTLYLSNNNLSGNIPIELANITSLRHLYLYDNWLEGNLPPEIGNMPSLRIVDFSYNQLSGSIPDTFGNLSTLMDLDLSHNMLTGTIPPSLGNLTGLESLFLSSNALVGEIPSGFANFSVLVDGYVDIGYNGLETDDPAVIALLNTKDPDWQTTQTVAPVDGSVVVSAPNSLEINWTPIPYSAGVGAYDVYYSEQPGGPYLLAGSTSDKTASSMTIADLTQGTTYYIALKTRSDSHAFNLNPIESIFSSEFSIRIPIPGVITITSPNGGEALTSNTVHTITWTTSGELGNLNISYSTSGINGTFIPIVENITNNGSYAWNVPEIDSDQCILRISDVDEDPSDTSDSVFTIGSASKITITTPNGGDLWGCGMPQSIKWTTNNVTGDVSIQLYKGDTMVLEIGTAPEYNGSFTWNIPPDFLNGEDYRIRIYQGSIEDFSDGFFSIRSVSHPPDFNNDGHADLYWRNRSTGENGVWHMSNTSRMAVVFLPALNPIWKAVGTGDFNGDGKPDIMWRHQTTGQNAVWYMDNNVRLGYAYMPPLSNMDWKCTGVGDFNGDGKPDIMWRHQVTGQNAVWYMNNTIRLSNAYLNTLGKLDWVVAGIADFNSDGKVDICWRNVVTGQLGVWYLNNTTRTGITIMPYNSNVAWEAAGLGDYNEDGKPDIIWRNNTTGQNALWYMNNTTRLGIVYLPTLGNVSWELGN